MAVVNNSLLLKWRCRQTWHQLFSFFVSFFFFHLLILSFFTDIFHHSFQLSRRTHLQSFYFLISFFTDIFRHPFPFFIFFFLIANLNPSHSSIKLRLSLPLFLFDPATPNRHSLSNPPVKVCFSAKQPSNFTHSSLQSTTSMETKIDGLVCCFLSSFLASPSLI